MDLFIIIWLFVFGAIFGSFFGCMGYRIPNKIKTTYPSSFCNNCKKELKWYMNIPIFSYIFLKGKCAYCNKKIDFIYFLCEILCACLFSLNYILFKFELNFFISMIFTFALIVTIVSDFKFYYISDRVLVISGLLLLIVLYYFDKSNLYTYLISGVIVFLVMFGLKILGNSMFGRESLGDGDIKLMGIIGLGLGLLNSFVTLFFASLIALIFSLINLKRHPDGLIPYGPFLLIGALLVVYFSSILTPYLNTLLSI